MHFRILIICMAGLLTVVGCAPSLYLTEKPYVMYPQSLLSESDENAQSKSMQALLDSFSDRRWVIHNINEEKSTITAEVCARGEHCVEVLATVNKNGSVELIRTPGQELSQDDGDLLRRWLGFLNKSYRKHMERG